MTPHWFELQLHTPDGPGNMSSWVMSRSAFLVTDWRQLSTELLAGAAKLLNVSIEHVRPNASSKAEYYSLTNDKGSAPHSKYLMQRVGFFHNNSVVIAVRHQLEPL